MLLKHMLQAISGAAAVGMYIVKKPKTGVLATDDEYCFLCPTCQMQSAAIRQVSDLPTNPKGYSQAHATQLFAEFWTMSDDEEETTVPSAPSAGSAQAPSVASPASPWDVMTAISPSQAPPPMVEILEAIQHVEEDLHMMFNLMSGMRAKLDHLKARIA